MKLKMRFFLLALTLAIPALAQETIELYPLVKPNLSKMKDPIRKKLEALHHELEEIIQRNDLTRPLLAKAFGRMGEHYQAHSLLEAAEPMMRNAAILDPKDPRWPYFLGIMERDKNNYAEAAEFFKTVLALKPDDHFAMGRLGQLLLLLNKPKEAADIFKKALKIAPRTAFHHQGMGMAASSLNQPQEAVDHLQEALALQPNASSLNYPLGLAWRKVGNMEKARQYIQQRGDGKVQINDPYLAPLSEIVTLSTLDVALAMAADMKTFNPRDFMGYIITNLGGRDGLIEYFMAAADDIKEHDPEANPLELARIHYAIGNLLGKEESDDDAIYEFDLAIELAPEFLEPYLEKGFLLRKNNRYQEAMELYNSLLEQDATNSQALLGRAQTYVAMNKLSQAIDDFEKLEKLDPDQTTARIELGKLLIETGNLVRAQQVYESLLRSDLVDDEKITVHNYLGMVFQRTRDQKSAIEHYQNSLQLDPKQDGARSNMAASMAVSGQFDEALAQYSQIIASDPGNEQPRLGYIAAAVLSKRYKEALSQLEDAHKSIPQSPNLTHLLARFLCAAPELDLRDGDRALHLVEDLIQKYKAPTILETYAMALAQAGRFEDAAAQQNAILSQMKQAPERLAINLSRYQAGQSCGVFDDPGILLP